MAENETPKWAIDVVEEVMRGCQRGSLTVKTGPHTEYTKSIRADELAAFIASHAPSPTAELQRMIDERRDALEFAILAPGAAQVSGSHLPSMVKRLVDFAHACAYDGAAGVTATELQRVAGERDALATAAQAFLDEPTIAGTVRAADNPDKAFAAEVPEYDADSKSIRDAANELRKALSTPEPAKAVLVWDEDGVYEVADGRGDRTWLVTPGNGLHDYEAICNGERLKTLPSRPDAKAWCETREKEIREAANRE